MLMVIVVVVGLVVVLLVVIVVLVVMGCGGGCGEYLRCQSGTVSLYSCPILSKLNRPSKPAR